MYDLKKRIVTLTDDLRETIIKYRREIHSHPELSGQEKETSAFVAAILESRGIEVKRNVGGHGVVGLLRGKEGGKTIAIRADMDALPLQDVKLVDYASQVKGVAHCCGHDVHTAILLGAASVLSIVKNRFTGNIKFIFQPSEEKINEGAKLMIEDGVLEDPAPAAFLGLHVFPELLAGSIGCKQGVITATTDMFTIVIHGRSGHSARPHQTIDAVLVASKVVTALQHIISRRIDPLHAAVITVGTIAGGTAENIVADRVELTGTVRALNQKVSERLPKLIEQVLKGITIATGATYEFTFTKGNPSVVNDKTVTDTLLKSAKAVLGNERVVILPYPTMGGEDFALFSDRIPSSFFRLGTGNPEKGFVHPLHHKLFDVDEDAIPVGIKVMTWTALSLLKQQKG